MAISPQLPTPYNYPVYKQLSFSPHAQLSIQGQEAWCQVERHWHAGECGNELSSDHGWLALPEKASTLQCAGTMVTHQRPPTALVFTAVLALWLPFHPLVSLRFTVSGQTLLPSFPSKRNLRKAVRRVTSHTGGVYVPVLCRKSSLSGWRRNFVSP